MGWVAQTLIDVLGYILRVRLEVGDYDREQYTDGGRE